jgi:hypothetical protein
VLCLVVLGLMVSLRARVRRTQHPVAVGTAPVD